MKTILLAEDDKKIAMALTVRLKSLGFSVVTAHDVPNALIMARKHDPDLALVDIGLPGGDGFRVADCLRTQVCARSVPIIFITASKKDGLRELAAKHGASGFLEKPFKASDLVAKIDSALLKVNSWQQPQAS
jgi:two-component system, OmpR family, response regulator